MRGRQGEGQLRNRGNDEGHKETEGKREWTVLEPCVTHGNHNARREWLEMEFTLFTFQS